MNNWILNEVKNYKVYHSDMSDFLDFAENEHIRFLGTDCFIEYGIDSIQPVIGASVAIEYFTSHESMMEFFRNQAETPREQLDEYIDLDEGDRVMFEFITAKD